MHDDHILHNSELASRSTASAAFGVPAWLCRVLRLTGLACAEILGVSLFADNARLSTAGGLGGAIGQWGAWTLRGCVAFAALFTTFACLKDGPGLRTRLIGLAAKPIAWRLLALHCIGFAVFFSLTNEMHNGAVQPDSDLAAAWLIVGLLAAVFGALAFIPAEFWFDTVRGAGRLPLYAALASLGACIGGNNIRALWVPAAKVTFYLTGSLLALFRGPIVSDAPAMLLGTPRFRVNIAPECSGFEGAGLMLAFSIVYLLCFRRECRFPHILLLIPAGIAGVFALNVFRIAALILLGDAGAKAIALGGFHSQAGWIAFSLAAFGFTLAAHRIAWFKAESPQAAAESDYPALPYVAPFLSILVAGMLATAASSGFEWFYSLRFVAVGAVLWMYRGQLMRLDWKFGKAGVVAGVAVFALWIAFDRVAGAGHLPMPTPLASASPLTRCIWVAFRALAASLTVPIAEELAFRGFLLRRIASRDFQSWSLRNVPPMALAISSITFGLLHGSRWIPGVLAGVIFGWVAMRKGRLGEAVAAHSVTNALLAVYVVTCGQWQFW